MKHIQLKVQARKRTGKGGNRQLRSEGQIPAVIYGLGQPTLNLKIDSREFQISTAKLGDEIVFFDLNLDGKSDLAMIREMQRDPVTERIVHIDMLRVDMSKPIDFMIPIHHKGLPVGVSEGGMLEQLQRQLHVHCTPTNVPEQVEIDITDLAIGMSVHVSDLVLDEEIEILSPASEVVLHVILPRIVEEEEPETEEEGEEGAEGTEGTEASDEGEKSEGNEMDRRIR